ncbi:6530_t:CDS:2 [Acaulospora colombiana]|uniref:6530_t:CDS:1 n=1 Tax=Acaulospora colombiana TaxID=27376 RepID=A0ACA9LEZ8_9GLOM|nr:6530_t:CDS:2 [Acaulospora colombiana]
MQSSLSIWTDSVNEQALEGNETCKKVSRSLSSTLSANTVTNRHKSRLVPVTIHPLDQPESTSSTVPSKTFNSSTNLEKEQSFTTSYSDLYLFSEIGGSNTIKKRPGLPDFNKVTNSYGSDTNGNKIELEKKMVIVHTIKPSDTLAGIALFYGIEQLPSAQLTYFPPHLSAACSAKSNPDFPSQSPSPMPVTHLSKNDPHVQISFPRPTIATDSRPTIVDKLYARASEKYRKSFDSVKYRKIARGESSISLTKKKV